MKRILFNILCAFLAFASCEKSQDKGLDNDRLVEWIFEAPQTKASLSANGTFSWSKGDEIAVWNSTGSAFVSFETFTGSGRFSADAPASAHFTDAAYHPASIAWGTGTVVLPSSYTLAELSVGKGMPMYAAVEEGSHILNFKHLGAYLTISISNVPAGDTQVIFSSDASLSGEFTVETINEEKVIRAASGSGSITVNISLTQIQDVKFTIPLPVGEYALTCTIPELLEVETDPVAFRRGHLYTLASIEANGCYHFTPTCETYDLDNWE